MQERWSMISEFPTYSVSNYGQVRNMETHRVIRQSITTAGVAKIGLVVGGKQYTRSVALLVAEAFVLGRTETFDTPVHIDGCSSNNRKDNLVWRPRWFACKYAKQFDDTTHHNRGPIIDLTTRVWYDTVLDASMANVLLIKDIMRSIMTKEECWPTRNVFGFRDISE